jgi:ABC-type Fe3+ transport system permease subunit
VGCVGELHVFWEGDRCWKVVGVLVPFLFLCGLVLLQTAVKGGTPAWGLGEGLTTPHCKEPACYKILHRAWNLMVGSC